MQLFSMPYPLLTAGYITPYNQGVIFFGLPNLVLFNINFWPLILLGLTGLFIGLAIKFLATWKVRNSSIPICSGRDTLTTTAYQASFFKHLYHYGAIGAVTGFIMSKAFTRLPPKRGMQASGGTQ